MTQNAREPVPAAQAVRVAARLRSAARRPVLSGASSAGDLALALAVMAAGIWTAVKGYLYVGVGVKRRAFTYQGITHIQPLLVTHSAPRVTPWVLLALVLATLPLALRRTYPTASFCVIVLAFIATSGRATLTIVAAVIFAAYCAVAYSRYRRSTLLALLAAAAVLTLIYPQVSTQLPERYVPLVVLLPTVAVGNMMHMWRERAGESATRLRLAEAEHEAEKRRVVEAERARIASELHDVVTHNVSVMVVQAGAARRVLDSSPGDARDALLAIEASGRTAMTDLRHLLGLLAPSGEPGANESDEAALRPQPSLAEVHALVDRVRAAGLPVELSVTGAPRYLPQGLDLASYRVVQEALTNVIKHADGARTVVRVDYGARNLLIDVANDAPAPAAAGAGLGGAGRGAGSGSGSGSGSGGPGRGLIGLRERIAIYRGSLDVGPRPGGGWRVRVTIPVGEAGDAAAPAGLHEVRA